MTTVYVAFSGMEAERGGRGVEIQDDQDAGWNLAGLATPNLRQRDVRKSLQRDRVHGVEL
jgi:hypothetical protein